MDERVEKAFQTANFMATLSNQRRIILEEFNQKLIFYTKGSTFTVNPLLITFISTLIGAGNTQIVLLDDNSIPVEIDNLEDFYKSILSIYKEATNEYIIKYAELKTKRRVGDLVSL